MTSAKLAGLIGTVVVAGAITGVVLENAGSIDPIGETSFDGTFDAVPYFDCHDGDEIGDLHRGDRVFLTGRNGDGSWLEVRAPFDTGSRVWVETMWIFPDDDPGDLPVNRCADRLFPAASVDAPVPAATIPGTTTTTSPADTTTTTTVAETSTTSTTVAETTTTTGAETTTTSASSTTTSTSTTTTSSTTTTTTAGTTTTTTSGATTTTQAADTTAPSIGTITSDLLQIWEDLNYAGCPTQNHEAEISVSVTDESALAWVRLRIQIAPSVDMTVDMNPAGGSLYSVDIGPFGDGLGGSGPVDVHTQVQLSVSARDIHDNQSPPRVAPVGTLELRNCAFS